jgi:nucleotidyltransferase substrate binding protein (TIGR01987 family)
VTRGEIVRKVRIWLYGSEATGDATPTSDIDIAFEDPSFHEMEKIKEEVESLPTLIKVDVTNIAHAEARFQQRVRDTGKVLYSATKELRFEDALHSFRKALKAFESVYHRQKEMYEVGFGDMYLDILVKRFEFTFEMSWKTIKRYLSFVGIETQTPRGTFKEAYQQGLLKEESVWMEMIDQRNLSSYEYDEQEVLRLIERAGRFYSAFQDLFQTLEAQYRSIRG